MSQDTSVRDELQQRAYDLYEERGKGEGRELDDWLRAENATLEEQIIVFNTIFEQLPVGTLVVDGSGKIRLVNREAERLLGAGARGVGAAEWVAAFGWYRPDQVTPFPADEMPVPLALRGENVLHELAFLRNPQQPGGVWVRVSAQPILCGQESAPSALVVLRDVTETRREHQHEIQLQLARAVQERLIVSMPVVSGLDVGSATHPAAETGGDYVDGISLPDGRLAVIVGDVSRHGLGSALVMALTRAYIRAYAAVESDPGRLLTRVNRMLADDLDHHYDEDRWFVTLLLVCLDPRNRTMVYASAGHVPGLLLDRSGQVPHRLESNGPPLGLFPEMAFVSSEATSLEPGQVIVLLSDGILEAATADEDYFGMERVIEIVRAHQQEPAQQIVAGLYEATQAFLSHAPQADDMTCAVVKISDNVAGSP